MKIKKVILTLFISFLFVCSLQLFQCDVYAEKRNRLISASFPADEKLFSPMTFSTRQECSGNGCAYYVLAEGVITPDTPGQFVEFMKSVEALPTVYFNSPGGNLLAGLKLGRIIREFGLDTYVGGKYVSFEGFDADGYDDIRTLVINGVCFSACSYSFMGGSSREIGKGGSLGVHQFYSEGGNSDESNTQLTMTVLATYLDEMGVDRRLLDVASLTTSNKIKTISLELAQELNIDNTNPAKGEWKVDVTRSGKLFAYTIQKQARRNAVIGIFLSRQSNQFVAEIRYIVKQKFRAKDELIDAFYDNEQSPRLCINSQDEYCRVSFTPKIIRNWKYQNDGSFTISLLLDAKTMLRISKAQKFVFDANFPRVYADINPSDSFSNKNLQSVLAVILKQR